MNNNNGNNKTYIYSPSLHQNFYQKIKKCFINYLPLHIIPNILNEEDIDVVIEEIVNNEAFQKSDIEIETYESIDEINFPQDYDGGIIILDDLNEKEMNDPGVQAMFKRSRHNNLSIFIISQEYHELPKRTIRANRSICHIFKPNNFRDVQNLFRNKVSYQLLTINMTKDQYRGRYRLGLNSIFVPNSSPF